MNLCLARIEDRRTDCNDVEVEACNSPIVFGCARARAARLERKLMVPPVLAGPAQALAPGRLEQGPPRTVGEPVQRKLARLPLGWPVGRVDPNLDLAERRIE